MSDIFKRSSEPLDGVKATDNSLASARDEVQKSGKAYNTEIRRRRSEYAQLSNKSEAARPGSIAAARGLRFEPEIATRMVKVINVDDFVKAPILEKSVGLVTSKTDRLLANEKDKYNCHFYTDTFVKGQEPGMLFFMKDKCIVDSEFLVAHQFKSVVSCTDGKFVDHGSDLRAGDVILVRDAHAENNLNSIHSAVVIRGGEKGQALIRQKFDADHPVVDLQIEQFDRAYLKSSPVEISVWRK